MSGSVVLPRRAPNHLSVGRRLMSSPVSLVSNPEPAPCRAKLTFTCGVRAPLSTTSAVWVDRSGGTISLPCGLLIKPYGAPWFERVNPVRRQFVRKRQAAASGCPDEEKHPIPAQQTPAQHFSIHATIGLAPQTRRLYLNGSLDVPLENYQTASQMDTGESL
ncbi:hypothetical protein Bbelb_275800 [Branchiostoma belcheri]|nr:hypothetical protein Bbelb_275800 [Branchiostoma belcheri]